MQGSYQNKGLPRPYYMKPTNTKKNSPYNNTPRNFFSTPKRKLLGYIVMMILFGSLMYVISQDIRGSQTQVYEVVVPEKKLEPEGKIAGSSPNDADKESENIELSINMAKGSKGDLGKGVAEAPKGGIANEAAVVGNDEEKIIGGKKSTPAGKAAPAKAPAAQKVI